LDFIQSAGFPSTRRLRRLAPARVPSTAERTHRQSTPARDVFAGCPQQAVEHPIQAINFNSSRHISLI
jgi:hypothetical protein